MDNVEIVRLLMDHGVTLRIPHQLSLDQLAARSAVACNDEQKSVSYELGPSVGEDQLGAVPSGVDDASITHHPSARGGTLATPSRKSLTTSSSLSVSRGRGQLAALDDLGLGDAFLHDEDVQCTLNWREYEAALLIHANVTIVEALLRWVWVARCSDGVLYVHDTVTFVSSWPCSLTMSLSFSDSLSLSHTTLYVYVCIPLL